MQKPFCSRNTDAALGARDARAGRPAPPRARWARQWAIAAPVGAAVLGLACGGSDEPGALAAEPGPSAPSDATDTSAAYLVGSRVFDDTTTTSYFHVLPGLDASVSVDSTRAVEVPGSATLYSAYDLGWFAIGSGEEPTITRYQVSGEEALAEGQSMSLFALGVADLWDTLYFASATKAYYPDREGGQLIVWNPSTMEVTGTVPLPETLRDGYLSLYGYLPVWRGTELLISVGWFDWDVTDSVLPETGLLVVDTTTDQVVRFETDTRCGGVTHPITLPSGDTYLVSSALAGAAHRVGRLPTAPCALKIPAGSNAFDPDYTQPLEALTGSTLVGEPVPAGDVIFLRAFDDALATVEGPTATWELTGQAAWRWLRWTPTTNEIVPMVDIPPSTADVTWFQVEGRVYGSETTPDYAQTTLIDLSAEGGPVRGVTVPGFVHGVTRIR